MQLLKHFKELTLHPKNAEELKGLILQLAVQGKLTKQWRAEHPNVEPASVLLEKINDEKERLIKEKKIKKEKPLTEISKEEISFNLPESWAWSRLGDYIHNFGQKTPDKEFEYIDVASIDNQLGVIKNDLNILSPHEAPSRARKIVEKGCVIYSTVRPYLLNIAVVDKEFSYEAIASTAFAILHPFLGCSEIYLYHVLRSYYFIEYVESCMKGVAYPAINDANLLVGLIPIPPLEEQKAIVEVVNQLFAEVEQLEALTKERIQLKADFVTSALNQLTQAAEQDTASQWAYLQEHFGTFFTEKENIKKLREGILQLAVQGKLTHHWRTALRLSGVEVEPAAKLLEKIKAEKEQLVKAGKIKNENPLPTISEEEVPYELPEGWIWCRLGTISQFLNGDRGKNYPNKNEYVEEGVAWINTGHINPNGTLSKKRMNFITKEKFDSLRSGKIKGGDLVYCLRGATFGKTAFVTPYLEGAVASSLMIMRNYLQETSDYTYNFLISPEGKRQLLRFDNGSAQPNLSANKVKLYLFPLAPLKEQKAIVENVKALMALCDKLEQEIKTHQTTQEQWMQSCLREAVEK